MRSSPMETAHSVKSGPYTADPQICSGSGGLAPIRRRDALKASGGAIALTKPVSLCAALVLGLAFWSPPQPASAEMYSYRDEQGKMHFTDQPHSIPKRYRHQAQQRAADGSVEEVGSSLLGAAARTDAVGNQMTGALIRATNKMRSNKNLYPLAYSQRHELRQFTNQRLTALLVSGLVLTLAAIAFGIHGFLTAHPGWAIANLILIVTVPIYVAFHVANNKGVLKLIALAAVLVPTVIMLKTSWELGVLMQRLIEPG